MKTAALNVRIEPEVKAQAEKIMREIGLTPAAAINLFYHHVILNQGLPFPVKKPSYPLDLSAVSQGELADILNAAHTSIERGEGITLNELKKAMNTAI